MVAEFRARMVGRVAILLETVDESLNAYNPDIDDKDRFALARSGAREAVEWVRTRYPHLVLTKHSSERPDLTDYVMAAHEEFWPRWGGASRCEYPVVLAIEFEDDQQATDFKLRWV